MFPNVTPNLDIPYGYCQCGCGQKTNLAAKTYTSQGLKKGQPYRYVGGHYMNAANAKLAETRTERFWAKVDKSGGDDSCWLWLGSLSGGYGNLTWNSRNSRAHRIAYLLTHGTCPAELDVRHTCDNPSCVNPAHLIAGTTLENIRDMVAKGRAADMHGENNPRHKLTWQKVEEIRRRAANGKYGTQALLAREYGVSETVIGHIVRRVLWVE